MLQVAAFTGGINVPSARYRVRQLIPALQLQSVQVQEFISAQGAYPPAKKSSRFIWATTSLLQRIPSIARSYKCDVTLLQREFISTFATLEGFTKAPRIFDVDDAIWLNRANSFAAKLAQNSDAVICGNDYLADFFSQWNKNIILLPTPVDATRFVPGVKSTRQIIGWTGTHANLKYLYKIEDALKAVLAKYPEAKIRIVSDQYPKFSRLQSAQIEFIRWTPENEVSSLQEMTVGLMPLENSDWEKGKCSYKMLLYMACGIPVVVSPVGMNAQVLALGEVGSGAVSTADWMGALELFLGNTEMARRMGDNGRNIVCQHFSIEVLAPKLAQVLQQVAGKYKL